MIVDISKIKANPKNPRVIKDDKFKKLVKSLQDFPEMLEKRPLVCFTDTDGKLVVLGGNMRLKAAKEIGLKELPVVLADDWTEEQKNQFLIKDNVGFGEWDWDDLANNLDVEQLNDWGLDVPDFKVEQEAEEDDYEIPDEVQTDIVLGDLFEIGQHRLLCGDSTNADDVFKLMNGSIIDLIYTDPPYGINEKGDRSNRGGLTKGNKLPDFKDDTIQYAVDAYNLVEGIGIKRQVWWGANYYCHHLPQSNNWFVWDKRVEEKQSDTQSDCELAWVKSKWSSVRIFRHLWNGLMKDSERGGKRVHATQKPVALAVWAFDYFKEVKTVMDLFTGSGSTLIACHQTNRLFFGMEIEPKYCQVIIDRMLKLDPTIEIKKNGQPYKKD